MAMGGLMKGHHHGHSSGSKGKPYGMMLLMAFGAAIVGVMVLHKYRERRVFNILVKEKDRELTTLQLLLQKERDHAREAKWKLEEMKTKVNTFRTHKSGLDSRILAMQSTISSLREEQRTIELALEEKQNEIKMMRERYTEMNIDNPQVRALSDTLRQKESEIEDLKNRLESPVKVWSVSTDDPSNASIDLHTKTSLTEGDATKVSEGKASTAELNDFTNHEVAEYSTEHADGSSSEPVNIRNGGHGMQDKDRGGNGGEIVNSREKLKEQTENVDDAQERDLEHGNTNSGERIDEDKSENNDKSQTEEASGIRENKNILKTEAVENHDREVQKSQEEINEGHNTEDKVLQTRGDGLLGRTSNTQADDNQELGMNYKGGMKLEKPDYPKNRRYRQDGNGYSKKTKRKRWTVNHKTRESTGASGSNGAAVTRSFEGTTGSARDRDGQQGTLHRIHQPNESLSVRNESGSEYGANKTFDKLQTSEGSKLEINEHVGSDHDEVREDLDRKKAGNYTQEDKDSPQGVGLPKHDEDAEDFRKEDRNTTSHLKVGKMQTMNDTSINTEVYHNSLKDVPTNTTLHFDDETSSEAKQQNQPESEQSEIQATGIEQLEERIEAHKEDEVFEQTETVNGDEEPHNPELGAVKQTESDTDASRESTLNSEAEGRIHNERPEEPEI